MTGRVTALLHVRPAADGSLAITVTCPAEDGRLTVDDTALEVTMWSESADVVRGRFVDRSSGAIAYFQSSDASLEAFARTIHLAVSS